VEEARFTTAALRWSTCLSPRFRKPTRAYFHGWSMEYGVAIGLALDGARLTPASLVRRPSYWYWMMDRLTQRRRTAAAPAAPSALSFMILGTVGCMRSQKQKPSAASRLSLSTVPSAAPHCRANTKSVSTHKILSANPIRLPGPSLSLWRRHRSLALVTFPPPPDLSETNNVLTPVVDGYWVHLGRSSLFTANMASDVSIVDRVFASALPKPDVAASPALNFLSSSPSRATTPYRTAGSRLTVRAACQLDMYSPACTPIDWLLPPARPSQWQEKQNLSPRHLEASESHRA